MTNDKGILHETANMYLNAKLEVCLNGATHAVVVGKVKSIEQGERVMRRLEADNCRNLRRMYAHN